VAITRETLRLVEEVRATVGQLTDGVTRRLTEVWVRAWDQLASDFVAALDEVLAATGGGQWPTRKQIQQATRLQQAIEATARALGALVEVVRAETGAAILASADAGGNAQAAVIASQYPTQLSRAALLAEFSKFTERDLAAVVARTSQRIHSLTMPLPADTVRVMKQELVRGVAVGDNPAVAARRMVERAEGAFNGGLARAMTIARTEILDAHRAAAQAGQDANSRTLRGWRWSASLTTTTCPACWAMHGTVHPLSQPGPQGHQNCRCSRAPLTKSWAALGFEGVDEPPDLFGDAEQVFRALPREDQVEILGPARLAAFLRGDVAWEDLATKRDNPGWRPSFVPTPVRDLTS
jgi:SPP1 gp7 family putative phage head morphogenesis protein